MLSMLICSQHNSTLCHSRNAYGTWKKKKLSLLNAFCKPKQKRFYVIFHSGNRLYLKQHELLQNISVASFKYAYNFLRHHCLFCVQFKQFVPKRNTSTSSNNFNWRKTYAFIVSYLPNKLVKKLNFNVNKRSSEYGFSYLPSSQQFSNQHVLDFPNFFKKDLPSYSQQHNSNLPNKPKTFLKQNITDSKTNNGKSGASQKETNSNKLGVTHYETSPQTVADDKIKTKGSVRDLDTKTSSKSTNRSQYEHLVTALSTHEEKIIKEENSVFSSLRLLYEVPVNSFFSFLSRSNLLEKKDSIDSKVDNKQVKSAEEQENSTESNEIIDPPKSMLEILYQYVPYVISTPPKQIEENTTTLKQQEIVRIKAEKELLHQKININNRTRYLLQAISGSISLFNLIQHIDELKDHLLRFPDTRITAINENGIQEIMNVYRTATDEDLRRSSRMLLAMLGAVDPPKMKGIRLLTIDGGGSRGIAAVEICNKIVELTGRPINETFDYICGVSTGAILGFALGVLKMPVSELACLYRDMSLDIFNQNRLVGTGNLVLSHAYYNTEAYQKIMKNIFGNQLLIETAGAEDVPKCSAVSTLVNRLPLKPFLWRNYSIVPGTRHTHWSGTCRATMWEAVRASSAAPGYFEEFKKGYNIHQDGGVLTNNPTGVALNECRLLWPHMPIQCVVSIGTGRYEPVVGPVGEEFSSLKDKLLKFVDSATNVTEIHKVMYDLLPAGSYFRFNPFLDEPLLLDEYRPEKMDLLVENTIKYIDTNDYKFRACARVLNNKM